MGFFVLGALGLGVLTRDFLTVGVLGVDAFLVLFLVGLVVALVVFFLLGFELEAGLAL